MSAEELPGARRPARDRSPRRRAVPRSHGVVRDARVPRRVPALRHRLATNKLEPIDDARDRRPQGHAAQRAVGALRRRHRRRPHLLCPARHHRRRDHRSAARHDRQADVRRRPPHRLPARDVRVRARAGVAAVRVDGAAQLPVLQLRAAEPALREAGRAEGLRAADRRRGAGGLRAGRGRGVGELRAAVGDPQGRHVRDPQAAAQHHAQGQPGSPEGAREGSREEGDRDGALRDSAGGVHGDGPHHLRASRCIA